MTVAPLRYSKKRHSQSWAYIGVVFFTAVGLGGAYGTLGLSLQLGNGPGMVAVMAALALVFLAFGGWAAAACMATTRPWWILEVRGSFSELVEIDAAFSRAARAALRAAGGP